MGLEQTYKIYAWGTSTAQTAYCNGWLIFKGNEIILKHYKLCAKQINTSYTTFMPRREYLCLMDILFIFFQFVLYIKVDWTWLP
jgi:hypothetical protein